ncbi:hypothetical protein ACFL1X_05765 [Candidatus Hydrogenedentota bacterium]
MKGSAFRFWVFLRNRAGFGSSASSFYVSCRQQDIGAGTVVFNMWTLPEDTTHDMQLANLVLGTVYRVTVEWDFRGTTDTASMVSVIEDPEGAGRELMTSRVDVVTTAPPNSSPDVDAIVGVAVGTAVTVEAQIDNIKMWDLNPQIVESPPELSLVSMPWTAAAGMALLTSLAGFIRIRKK